MQGGQVVHEERTSRSFSGNLPVVQPGDVMVCVTASSPGFLLASEEVRVATRRRRSVTSGNQARCPIIDGDVIQIDEKTKGAMLWSFTGHEECVVGIVPMKDLIIVGGTGEFRLECGPYQAYVVCLQHSLDYFDDAWLYSKVLQDRIAKRERFTACEWISLEPGMSVRIPVILLDGRIVTRHRLARGGEIKG